MRMFNVRFLAIILALEMILPKMSEVDRVLFNIMNFESAGILPAMLIQMNIHKRKVKIRMRITLNTLL